MTLFVHALIIALVPGTWTVLSTKMKGVARQWFIERAESKGIPWKDSYQSFHSRKEEYKALFEGVRNPEIMHPEYYCLPFHGYDEGNLNWKAAFEMEASSFSMTSAYWEDTDYGDASRYVRSNFTQCVSQMAPSPHQILDVGCATGISTAYLAAEFPTAAIIGIDLSPYFLAVANDTCGFSKIEFQHENAEMLPYEDDSFDLVCISYVMHELPEDAARKILAECSRILCKKKGVLAIVDLDPQKLQTRLVSPFRKWAFEATEPHIFNYNVRPNCGSLLVESGFPRVSLRPNDPLNTAWIGLR